MQVGLRRSVPHSLPPRRFVYDWIGTWKTFPAVEIVVSLEQDDQPSTPNANYPYLPHRRRLGQL